MRVFNGRTGVEARSFFAYEPAFAGGVRVAAGDVNGDGRAEIITGPGPGRAPEARVFDAATAALLSNVLAYPSSFNAGVFVATAVPVNRMAIDAPAPGATVHGPFQLTGWAFDEHPVNRRASMRSMSGHSRWRGASDLRRRGHAAACRGRTSRRSTARSTRTPASMSTSPGWRPASTTSWSSGTAR